MAKKPLKHQKVCLDLNKATISDIIPIEVRFDASLKEIFIAIEKDYRNNELFSNNASFGEFIALLIGYALENTVENFVDECLKTKFKGNASIISNLTH